LRHKIRKGERCGSVRFGSVIDPGDPRRSRRSDRPNALMPCPAEVEAIALMRRLSAEGKSLRAIAAELTRRGIPTKDARPRWQHSTVQQILARTE
jgi:hypothetical protein